MIWVLAGALVLSLLVIAFLVGRDTARTATTSVAVEQPIERPIERADPIAAPQQVPQDVAAKKQEPLANAAPTAQDGSVAQVVSYFAKVDSIQAGPAGISAESFAQQIAADAAQGKTEGFDQLQSDLDRMDQELRALAPPPVCKEFHDLTISSIQDAKSLMGDLRRTFTTGDAAGAMAIAGKAQAAQAKTEQIKELRTSIERRYGLAR